MLCLFFAEFDNELGPKISAQVPHHFLSNGDFDKISDYVIAKQELCGRIFTLRASISVNKGANSSSSHSNTSIISNMNKNSQKRDVRVITHPLCVENRAYERHAYFFAFGMVFDASGSSLSPKSHERAMKKFGSFMRTLEVESMFISKRRDSSSSSNLNIEQVLTSVFYSLNQCGECFLRLNGANFLSLKLVKRRLEPPDILDFQVPVKIKDMGCLAVKDWDFTIQRILPHIDGIKYVKRIALDADIDANLVRGAIRQLVYYQCVVMVDIFQYSNTYACTPRIAHFAENKRMQQECARYIVDENCPSPPPFPKIFALYCSLQPGVRVGSLCHLHDTAALNINDRRFIIFGLMHRIIRRIHKFPVTLLRNKNKEQPSAFLGSSPSSPMDKSNSKGSASSSSGGLTSNVGLLNFPPGGGSSKSRVHAMANGHHCYDDICCSLMRSAAEVDMMLRVDKNVVILHK